MLLSAELFSSDIFFSYSSGSQSPSSPPEGENIPHLTVCLFLKLIIKNNVLLMIQVEFKWKKPPALLNIFFPI